MHLTHAGESIHAPVCAGMAEARAWATPCARLITYADDLVILCQKGNAEAALDHMRRLMGKLKLTMNEEKTRICNGRQRQEARGEAHDRSPDARSQAASSLRAGDCHQRWLASLARCSGKRSRNWLCWVRAGLIEGHRKGEYCLYALAEPPRRLDPAARLDNFKELAHVGRSNLVTRQRADWREHVTLEASEHIGRVHLGSARMLPRMPVACDLFEGHQRGLGGRGRRGLDAARDLLSRLVEVAAGFIVRDLGIAADRQQLFGACESILDPPRRPPIGSNVQM
jgi:hypothetical protein